MSGAGRAPSPVLHATLIAAWRRRRWRGVLLQGASGMGKSDLALRALAAGWRLVADDRVSLWTSGNRLYGAAPCALAGLLEVRGLGVTARAALTFAAVEAVVEAATPQEPVERIPDPACVTLLGMTRPRLRLDFREPSAVAKLDAALDAALRGRL